MQDIKEGAIVGYRPTRAGRAAPYKVVDVKFWPNGRTDQVIITALDPVTLARTGAPEINVDHRLLVEWS